LGWTKVAPEKPTGEPIGFEVELTREFKTALSRNKFLFINGGASANKPSSKPLATAKPTPTQLLAAHEPLPEAVRLFMDNPNKITGDMSKFDALCKDATEWLVKALSSAYLDKGIKEAARRLLVVWLFTLNLPNATFRDPVSLRDTTCWDLLKSGLKARLDELGESLREG
jgi:hypothetical protein